MNLKVSLKFSNAWSQTFRPIYDLVFRLERGRPVPALVLASLLLVAISWYATITQQRLIAPTRKERRVQ
jgi:hypothetical protein